MHDCELRLHFSVSRLAILLSFSLRSNTVTSPTVQKYFSISMRQNIFQGSSQQTHPCEEHSQPLKSPVHTLHPHLKQTEL
uniref:Secreted protein n=2 Tax=Anguilla anguilla TaxID=7936 RepID=A0A0E9VKS4_ANGAN